MIYPKFLTNSSTIGITAPSDGKTDKLDLIRLDNAYLKLKSKGFNIIETSNVRESVLGRSAKAEVRAKNLEKLFLDDNVDIIISVACKRYTDNFSFV